MNLIRYMENRDFFEFAFKILTFIGANPAKQTRFATSMSILHYTCFVLIFLVLEIYYLVLHVDDNVEFVKTIGTCCYHIVGIMRAVHTFSNIKNYYTVWNKLNRHSFAFETIGFEGLYQGDYEINLKIKRIQESTMKKANLTCYGVCVMLVMGAMTSIAFSWGRVLFGPMQFYVDDKSGKIEVVNKVPYNYYQILDITNPIMYRADVIYSSYAISFLSLAFLLTDSLFQATIIYMTSQIKILNSMIKLIKIPSDMQINSGAKVLVTKIFKKCLDEAECVININDDCNNFMETILFYHYMFANYVMCSIVYILPEEEDKSKFWGYCIFGVLAICHPLLCCWNNQVLMDDFVKLSDAIYHIDGWEDSTISFKKALQISMRRFQKPMCISIGKFSKQNLKYFLGFLQRAYSFYTLLRNTS